jgi:O-antigen ligase/Tfp pilus assembly protein PilF
MRTTIHTSTLVENSLSVIITRLKIRPQTVTAMSLIILTGIITLLILSSTRPRIVSATNRNLIMNIIASGSLLLMIAIGRRDQLGRLANPLDFRWLLLLGLTGLTVLRALDPRAALEGWLLDVFMMLPVMYGTIYCVRAGLAARLWIRALLLTGAFVLAQMAVTLFGYGVDIAQAITAGVEPRPFRLWGVLDNPAIFGMLLALLLPLAVGYCFYEGLGRRERRAVLALALVGGVGVVAHGTRSATIATAIGLAAVGALIVTRGQRWVWRLRPRAYLIVAAVFIIGLVVTLWVQGRAPNHAETGARLDVYAASLAAFSARPLTGWGPGGFVAIQERAFSVPPIPLVPHSHSLILGVAAEGGLAGLIGYGIFILGGVRLCIHAWQTLPQQRGLLIGINSALIGFLTTGLFDQPLSQPALGIAAVILLGMVAGMLPVPERQATSRGFLAMVGLCAFLGLMYYLGVQYNEYWNIFYRYSALPADAPLDQRRLIVGQLEQAQAKHPTDALLTLQLGYWSADLAMRDPALLPGAISAMQSAARSDPAFSVHQVNLASLYARGGDHQQALEAAQAAVDRAPGNPNAWLVLGMQQEATGAPNRAQQSFMTALQLEPRWFYAPFWAERDRPARAAAYQAALQAFRRAPLTFETALLIGDAPAAFKAARDGTEALVALGYQRLESGDTTRALATFRQALRPEGSEPAYLFAALGIDRATGNSGYPTVRLFLQNSGPYGPGTGADLTYAQYTFWRIGLISAYVAPETSLDSQIDPATLGKPLP